MARPKTTTSTESKRKYNDKHYAVIKVELDKDLVARFKSKCKGNRVSQASVIKKMIEKFLEE